MSRGVDHSVSDHVCGDRPRGARQAMMAAGRLHAGRDYGWRGARRIILRSGDIAVRNAPDAGRCVRMYAFVTSDGIGGTDGVGGTVPLGDGRGQVVAGPGSGCGAADSGMASSLGTWGPAAAPPATAGLAACRNAATENGRARGR